MSAVSVDATRERVDRTVFTYLTVLRLMDCGTCVVRGLASAFLSGADGYADFAGDVAVGVASPAVFAGDVAVGMASPAVAGAATLLVMLLLERLHWPLLGWCPWPTLLRLSLLK